MSASDEPHDGDFQRLRRIQQVVREHYRRLAAGESVTEAAILRAHPDLMPELAKELATLHLIEEARVQAAREDTEHGVSAPARQESTSQTLQIRCPLCHTPVEVAADASFSNIVCSACGSHFSLIEEEPEINTADGVTTIGRFELLQRLGRGGFGTVWKARDVELGRAVAVKVPRKEQLTPAEIEQFLREARVAAQLKHPNIVAVHEVGREGDTVFIVTDLICGFPLSEWLKGRRASVREAAELCLKIAEALHHAHEMGVIHRDLKPQNIIVDADGQPQVTDFGLARHEAGEVTVTMDGQVLGTPAYMSPEQAKGEAHQADCRCDIYSLGVILFELLTGELPFRGNVRMLMQQVIHDEPVSPRKLSGNVPRDLETICLKCLEKDVRQRYDSAKELADDLQRFLRGEPIMARPINRVARAWRWSRRNPMAATVVGLAAFLAVAGPLTAIRQYTLAGKEAESRMRADQNLYQSLIRQSRAMRLARESGYRRNVFDVLKQALAIDTPMRDLDELRQEAVGSMGDFTGLDPAVWQDFSSGLSEIALHPTLPQLVIGRADGTVTIRNLADGSEVTRLPGHASAVVALVLDGRGQLLASGDDQANIRLWRLGGDDRWVPTRTIMVHGGPQDGEASAINALAIAPEGDRLVVSHSEGTQLTTFSLTDETREPTVDQLPPVTQVRGTAFSSDARLLARAQQRDDLWEVLVWDIAQATTVRRFSHDLAQGIDVNFSPDDRLLLYSCTGGVGTYDLQADRHTVLLRDDCVNSVAMSSDCQILAACCPFFGQVRLWGLATDREIDALQYSNPSWPRHVMFGDRNRLLIAAFDAAVYLWNLAGTDERLAPPGHIHGVPSVAFNRQGTMLASAGTDRTVRLWDLSSRDGLLPLSGFLKSVQTVAFSPDGLLLATGDWSGDIWIWDPHTGERLTRIAKGPTSESGSSEQDPFEPALSDGRLGWPIWAVAFSNDGQYFAAGQQGIQLWRVSDDRAAQGKGSQAKISFEPMARPTEDLINSMCFSPNSQLLAWNTPDVSEPSWIPCVWDLEKNRLVRTLPKQRSMAHYAIAFCPDSKLLMFPGGNRTIEAWNVMTGKRVLQFAHSNIVAGSSIETAALSCDGRLFAWAVGSTVTIWDTQQQRRLLELPPERGAIWCVAWSPDSQWLALGTSTGGPILWHLPTIRRELASLGLDW